jgi:hypothetical protein
LDLDEDISNLIAFGKCIGGDIVRRSSQNNVVRDAWPSTEFLLKQDGKSSSQSDVRALLKQKTAMISALAFNLKASPIFKNVAASLLQYEQDNRLWLPSDYVDREE